MKFKSKDLNTFAKAGIPLVTLIIGGSYYLTAFIQTSIDVKDKRTNSMTTRKFSLEEEHKKMMKNLDLDNYSLSRIPRPEDSNTNSKGGKSNKS